MKNMKRIHKVTLSHETKGIGSFARVNVKAIAEVTLTAEQFPIQRIESRCEYGIYPNSDMPLSAYEAQRLGELRQELRAIGFSTRAIAGAFHSAQHLNPLSASQPSAKDIRVLIEALQSIRTAYQTHFDEMPVFWQTYDEIARQALDAVNADEIGRVTLLEPECEMEQEMNAYLQRIEI